jgi:hypothetical protein
MEALPEALTRSSSILFDGFPVPNASKEVRSRLYSGRYAISMISVVQDVGLELKPHQ